RDLAGLLFHPEWRGEAGDPVDRRGAVHHLPRRPGGADRLVVAAGAQRDDGDGLCLDAVPPGRARCEKGPEAVPARPALRAGLPAASHRVPVRAPGLHAPLPGHLARPGAPDVAVRAGPRGQQLTAERIQSLPSWGMARDGARTWLLAAARQRRVAA